MAIQIGDVEDIIYDCCEDLIGVRPGPQGRLITRFPDNDRLRLLLDCIQDCLRDRHNIEIDLSNKPATQLDAWRELIFRSLAREIFELIVNAALTLLAQAGKGEAQ